MPALHTAAASMSTTARFLSFALVLATATSSSFAQTHPAVAWKGYLEAFLKNTKNASVERKPVGTLTRPGRARAVFTAVVAWDPSSPDTKVKGLEVRLQDVDLHCSVYLDDNRNRDRVRGEVEDSLGYFQEKLAGLIMLKDKALKEADKSRNWPMHRYPGIITDGGSSTQAVNPGDPASPNRLSGPTGGLNVGWFRHGNKSGVDISMVDCPCPLTGHRFLFPGADLETVVDIIARGRALLDTH